MVGINPSDTRTGFPPGWEQSDWGGIIQQNLTEQSASSTLEKSTISRSERSDSLNNLLGVNEAPPDLPKLSAPQSEQGDSSGDGGSDTPTSQKFQEFMKQINSEGNALFTDFVNTELSVETRQTLLSEMRLQAQEVSFGQQESVFAELGLLLSNDLVNSLGGTSLGVSPGKLTSRDESYLDRMGADSKALNRNQSPDDKAAFRFAGNFMAIITKMMAFVHYMKGLIASIDSEAVKVLGEAEEANTKQLIQTTVDRMEKSIEKRELMKSQSDIGKWILFVATSIASIVLSVFTAGKSLVLMAILMTVTLTTMVMQAMEMAGVSVTKALCEAFGMDPEKDDWIMKLIVGAIMIVAAFAAAGAAIQAGIGNLSRFTTASAMKVVAVNVVPSQIFASNIIFEIVFRIAVEAGMDEEDAAYLAMAMSLLAIIIVTVAAMAAGPKLVAKGDTGSVSAPGGGSKPKASVKAKMNKKLDSFQKKWDKMSASEKASMVEAFAQVVQAAGGLAGTFASIQQAVLTKERADLQYDIAILDALKEMLQTLNAMFGETRQAILHDLENGTFKMATDLHKFFEQLVQGMSSSVSELSSAASR